MANKNKSYNNKNKNKKQDFGNRPRKQEEVKDCTYQEGITVKELADKIGKSPAEIIKFLFMMGQMVTIMPLLTMKQFS